MNRNYQHNGFQYEASNTGKGDVYRLEHYYINLSTGEKAKIEFTPYCFMSKLEFMKYIDLGMPSKGENIGYLSPERLRKLSK